MVKPRIEAEWRGSQLLAPSNPRHAAAIPSRRMNLFRERSRMQGHQENPNQPLPLILLTPSGELRAFGVAVIFVTLP
jgi:hypothetical protein